MIFCLFQLETAGGNFATGKFWDRGHGKVTDTRSGCSGRDLDAGLPKKPSGIEKGLDQPWISVGSALEKAMVQKALEHKVALGHKVMAQITNGLATPRARAMPSKTSS
jgi:hypothetical protein